MIKVLTSIPKSIQEALSDRTCQIDDVGMSSANIMLYDDLVLKVEKTSAESNIEHEMIAWLSGKLPVPKVIQAIQENNTNYLLMARLKGEYACSDDLLNDPPRLVKVLVEGLELLWAMDVTHCPSKNTLSHKLERACYNVEHDLCDMDDAEPNTYGEGAFPSPKALLNWLVANQPAEDIVFSHGDYCLPNLFVHENQISGFIDLGRAGIGDKYQDIALCYRSLVHNFDGTYSGKPFPNFEPDMLFSELGITPDWEKIQYYTLLDELF